MKPVVLCTNNLLLMTTFFYAAGIAATWGRTYPAWPFWCTSLACGLLGLWVVKQRLYFQFITLFLAFFFFGVGQGSLANTPSFTASHIKNVVAEKQEFVVIGRVLRSQGFNGETSQFDMRLISYRTKETVKFRRVTGDVRLTFPGILPETLLPGCDIAVRAILHRPYRYNTPGGFNFPRYLAEQNIFVVGRITSPLFVHPVSITSPGRLPGCHIERLRSRINTFIDNQLPPKTGAIYKALLTGDRRSISQDTLERFKIAGCLHLLAISGLHLSLLGLVLYKIFFYLLRRSEYLMLHCNCKKTAIVLTIIPLLFYTMLAGGKVPVLRACIMSLLVALAFCSDRKHCPFTLIGCAALMILLLTPASLFSASFQLSFGAVTCIIGILPLLSSLPKRLQIPLKNNLLRSSIAWILTALLVSAAATLGTAPLLVFHFNRISLTGFFANIIIEPLLCLWSLIIGFFATVLIFIHAQIAAHLFHLGGYGIELADAILKMLTTIPFASIYIPTPPIPLIILFYLSLPCLTLWQHMKSRFRIVLPLLPPLCLCLLFFPVLPPKNSTSIGSSLAVLDIGHGSCNLLSLPGGRQILIDCGAMTARNFDIGKNVVAPFLWQQRIRKIDDIVITHPDSDHYNGVPFILDAFTVKRLWISGVEGGSEWRKLLAKARRRGISIKEPQKRETVVQQNTLSLEVLANTSHTISAGGRNNGLVLRFFDGKTGLLFPGDIPKETELQLVKDGNNLDVDILLASHHGSATSNCKEFIAATSPEQIIVSAGRSRRDHFPSPMLEAYCREEGIPLLATHSLGTIFVTIENGAYSIVTPLAPEQSQ